MKVPSQCGECPMSLVAKGFALHSGAMPPRSGICILLESPGPEEPSYLVKDLLDGQEEMTRRRQMYPDLSDEFVRRGAPVVGRAGTLLWNWIAKPLGLQRGDVAVFNTICCYPGKAVDGTFAYPKGDIRKKAEASCANLWMQPLLNWAFSELRCYSCYATMDVYERLQSCSKMHLVQKGICGEGVDCQGETLSVKSVDMLKELRRKSNASSSSGGISFQDMQEMQKDFRSNAKGKIAIDELLDESKVLQPELRNEINAANKSMELEGRRDDASGVQSNSRKGSPIQSTQECESLCIGASSCDGKGVGSLPSSVGKCPSPQRNQDRQSTRESTASDRSDAFGERHVSSLPKGILDSLECSSCKKKTLRYNCTVIETMHPAALARDIVPLPVVLRSFERAKMMAARGERVVILMGGKAAKHWLGYGENTTRWANHFQVEDEWTWARRRERWTKGLEVKVGREKKVKKLTVKAALLLLLDEFKIPMETDKFTYGGPPLSKELLETMRGLCAPKPKKVKL